MSNNINVLQLGFRVNWKKMAKCNISTELRKELNFLTFLFRDLQWLFWKTPVAQSVLRIARFHAHLDALLEGLGTVCAQLWFLIRFTMRRDVHLCTKNYVVSGPLLITISRSAGIHGCAAMRIAVLQGRHYHYELAAGTVGVTND